MRYLTSGESHGPELTAIIEGIPSGLELLEDDINVQLSRRQKGHGRGNRMKIENDKVSITSGVRHGITLGSPVAVKITNKDWVNWEKIMSAHKLEDFENKRQITHPRPGHADLTGGIKYDHRDMRNVLERSSARETAIRVAVGAVARKILSELGIQVFSHVREIGGVRTDKEFDVTNLENVRNVDQSPVRCADKEIEQKMIHTIDDAKKSGDTLGGVVEVVVTGMPIGVGSYVHYDRKLDSKLAAAVMSINAIKAVEFGIGFDVAKRPGSLVHDEIVWDATEGYSRSANNAGGIEGGMSNGLPIVIKAAMKPIPTLMKPLKSVDIESKQISVADIERSDVCAVPAAAVVAENIVAWELASAIIDQYYSDRMDTLKKSVQSSSDQARGF